LKNGENVWAGLLKKAWFEPWEVKAFREGKLKPENETWKKAMEKMREATEVTMRDFNELKLVFISSKWNKSELLKALKEKNMDKAELNKFITALRRTIKSP